MLASAYPKTSQNDLREITYLGMYIEKILRGKGLGQACRCYCIDEYKNYLKLST